jgi:hypothetical protein
MSQEIACLSLTNSSRTATKEDADLEDGSPDIVVVKYPQDIETDGIPINPTLVNVPIGMKIRGDASRHLGMTNRISSTTAATNGADCVHRLVL